MGQCQSDCQREVPTTVEVLHTANAISSSAATFLKSHPPLSIDTSVLPGKYNGKLHLRVQTQDTPSTVSMNSRSTPASSYQEERSTPPLNNEELNQALNPLPSKSKQKKRRSRNHSMNDSYPVTSARPRASFTPVVSLNACKTAFIPEERDTDAPSDEEEDHRDVELQRKLEQPHMRHQRHIWVHTAKSGVSPLSIDLPSLSPVPPDNKAVHPQALSHFQKLKIAAQVASEQMKRHQRISAEEERIQDIYDQRQRWTEYEAIQSSCGDRGLDVNSSTSEQADKKERKQKHNHSFDLSDTDSWYFDFQGHDFDADGRKVEVDPYCDDDSTSQASLSLLSQSSMEAQRRLFAAKARRRGKGESQSTILESKSVDAKSRRSTFSVPRNDYGPKQKIKTGMTSVDAIEGLEFEFASQVVMRNGEDCSHVSDIGDAYSMSNSTNFTAALNNDYKVARRRYRTAAQQDDSDSRNSVDPRFEETLRAVKIGKLEQNDRVISAGSSLSARLDTIERQLAAVEHATESIRQNALTDRSGNKKCNVSALISVFETPRVSSTNSSSASSNVGQLPPLALPSHDDHSVQSKSRRLEKSDLTSKQLIRSTMDSSTYHEQIHDNSVMEKVPKEAQDQRAVASAGNPSIVNFKTGKLRPKLLNGNGSNTDDVATQSSIPRNFAHLLQPKIKPRNTAERVRCLSHLVHHNNISSQLSGSRLPHPCNSSECKSIRQRHSSDELGQNCHVFLRESRVPPVLGPSTEEFLQSSEKFRDTLNPERSAHGDDSHALIEFSSHCEDASLYSDASSTSEFGEIMAMKPKCAEDEKKRHLESNNFADSSLLRAEKVEAQVNDVLTKYRETSS